MVTWTPTVIVIVDVVYNWIKKECNCDALGGYISMCTDAMAKCTSYIFGRVFPFIVGKGWYIWLILYTLVGIGGCIIVFVNPRLKLPTSSDFQLFPSSNVLEAWDLGQYNKLVQVSVDTEKADVDVLPLYFVFGYIAKDQGSWLDPDDKGGIPQRDENFNFYSIENQIWLE